MTRPRVLFLCSGNSARSQMAEAFLRKHAPDRFESFSAGLTPQPINPLVVRAMEEVGVRLDGHRSKSVREYLGQLCFGHLVIVCDEAKKSCPTTFPGVAQVHHWPFDDPSDFAGSDEEKLVGIRRVRDEIEARIKAWLAEVHE